jgi:hypothetical protein
MKARNPFQNISILGVSDGYLTAHILAKIYRKQYTNFHYHLEPKLDITKVSNNLVGSASIISCSEVLEHVEPPIQMAFDGLFQLLRLGGVLVLSVPHTDVNGKHIEHFPVMKESQILTSDGGSVLWGKSPEGEILQFKELTFHGGVGATLEYRVFSQESLKKSLESSNFKFLKSCKNNLFFGIKWEPWSRVWTATK